MPSRNRNRPSGVPGHKTLAYCFGCGAPVYFRRDRYDRPYMRCMLCGMNVFCRTDASVAGFLLMQKIIMRNPKRYRRAVLKSIMTLMKDVKHSKNNPTVLDKPPKVPTLPPEAGHAVTV